MGWDQASEVERWLEFWEEAVKQVYDVYMEHGTSTWTPTPVVGGQEFKPSRFAKLLEDYLDKANERGTKAPPSGG